MALGIRVNGSLVSARKEMNLTGAWTVVDNGASNYLNVGMNQDVGAYGAVGDGVTDDTVAIQAAITAAPAGSTVQLASGKTYLMNQINVDARMRLKGAGKELTRIKAVKNATGPLINWNGASFRPGSSVEGFSIDMNNSPTVAALYMHNVRSGVVRDLYIDHCSVGVQLDLAQSMNVYDVDVFNATTAAFKGTHATSSGNTFTNCFSDNTTVTGIDGFYFDGGLDWWCIGCRAFRAPGIAFNLQYGFRWEYTVANDNATGLVLGCSADGMTDGTSASTTVAGIRFSKASNCNVRQTFVSCAPVTDATSNTCIEIANGSNSVGVDGNYLSGQGIKWSGTTSTNTVVTPNNRFYSPAFGTPNRMFTLTTNPTSIDVGPNDTIAGSSAMDISDSATNLFAALTYNAQRRWGLNPQRPTAAPALYETFPHDLATTNATALTSGTLYMFAVYLPKGLKVTNINWAVGNTSLTLGTTPHYWVALYDSSKALLRQSTDDVAAVITQNAIKTSALASAFTTTYDGLHYIGVMSAHGGGAGANPTYANFASLSALTNITIARAFTADTGLVGTAPNPAGAASNIGNRLYAYVS